MKKIMLILTVLTSVVALGDSREDMVEDQLMKKYPTITDGTNTVKIHDYDVDIDKGQIEIKIELKDDANKVAFGKLNQEKLAETFTEITKYAQTELTKPLPIELKVELDRDVYPDENLYKNIFLD